MKWLSHMLYGTFMLVFVLGVALFFAPSIPYIGHLEVKIVKSGSMEPDIKTGSIVAIREMPSYAVGDVITFTSRTADIPTTHRIIDVSADGSFITKGDANEERDADVVYPREIIGRVFVDLPYVGFILDFARQPLGFALLIGIPAFLIIFDELDKMWVIYRNRTRGRKQELGEVQEEDRESVSCVPQMPALEHKRVSMHDIVRRSTSERVHGEQMPLKEPFAFEGYAMRGTRKGALSILACICGVGALFGSYGVGDTVSYFRDLESALNNILGAHEVDFTFTADETSYVIRDGGVDDPDGQIAFSILPVGASRPLLYRVAAEMTGGDAQFCDTLMGASVVPFVYNDTLPLLQSGTSTSFDGFGGAWNLGLMCADQGLVFEGGTTCMITITVTGWDAVLDESKSQYADEESVTLTFAYDGPAVLPLALPLMSELVSESGDEAGDTTEVTEAGEEESTPPESHEESTSEPTEDVPVEEVTQEEDEETDPSVPSEATDEGTTTEEEATPAPEVTTEEESSDTISEETTTDTTE